MNPWISVADRLPDDLTPVVAWVVDDEGPGPCIARRNVATWEMQMTLNWKDGLWSPVNVNVTHWTELPPGAK